MIRAGFGLYFNDLAQNGWATAFQAVNTPPGSCVDPVANPGGAENAGCIPGDASGGTANLIDPGYRTPYAIHISGGAQHGFGAELVTKCRLYSRTGQSRVSRLQLYRRRQTCLLRSLRATTLPRLRLFRM